MQQALPVLLSVAGVSKIGSKEVGLSDRGKYSSIYRNNRTQKARSISHEDESTQSATEQIHQYASSSASSRNDAVPQTALAYMGNTEESALLRAHQPKHASMLGQLDSTMSASSPASTRPRSLSDIHVDSKIIDECFQMCVKYDAIH